MLEENKKNEIRKKISRGLAVARIQNEETQKDVAKSGIIRSNRLSQVEQAKTGLTAEEFVALCEYYETTPNDVLCIIGNTHDRQLKEINHLLQNLSPKDKKIILEMIKAYVQNI